MVYQKDKRDDGGDRDWWSVGARPVYAFSEQFKLVAEVGHDQIDATDGTRKLSKFTIAPTGHPPVRLLGAAGVPPVLHLRQLERRGATGGQRDGRRLGAVGYRCVRQRSPRFELRRAGRALVVSG